MMGERKESIVKDFETELPEVHRSFENEHAPVLGEDVAVHVIAQSHLDLCWKWDEDDTGEMIYATVRDTVEKLNKNKKYTFSQSQVYIYDYIRRKYPALFDELKKLVAEGRWEIVGGQWVEPDHNLPDEESTVRQFLYGQKFIKKHFGGYTSTGWSPDGFGHNRNLPQILIKSGIDFFVHKRPRQKSEDLPVSPYVLTGIDGSAVIALRSNNKGAGLPKASEGYEFDCSEVEFVYKDNHKYGINDLWGPLGVGDTGGANNYHDIENYDYPNIKFFFSTTRSYFDRIKDKKDVLPVVNKEINLVYPGCYTTHADIKIMNRVCERKLEQAEALSTILYALDGGCPSQTFEMMWKKLLFNQFHDIITGTCIDRVGEKAVRDLKFIEYSAELVIEDVIDRLAGFIDTSLFDKPFVIFNTSLFERDEIFCIETTIPFPQEGFLLKDGSGCEFEGEIIYDELLDGPGNYHKMKLLFKVDGIPSMGYKVLGLYNSECSCGTTGKNFTDFEASEASIENPYYRIDFGNSGDITCLYDKQQNRVFNRENMGFAYFEILHEGEYVPDYGYPLKAWNFGFTGVKERMGFTGAKVVEKNKIRTVLRQMFEYGHSKLIRNVILYEKEKRIDFEISLEWYEIEKYLGVIFPVDMGTEAKTLYKIPFGLIQRKEKGKECPSLNYMLMEDDRSIFALMTEDRYGFSVTPGNDLRLSVIRCSNDYDNFSDRGRYEFRYSVVTGNISEKDIIVKKAEAYRNPVVVRKVESNRGRLPARYSFISADNPCIMASALKKAENDDALILRLYNISDIEVCTYIKINIENIGKASYTGFLEDNPDGFPCTGTMEVIYDRFDIEADFGRYEIKTIKLEKRKMTGG